ncbi:MAG: ROK family protein [Planctomycetes bacterium]|nr:ROK family protein [Planctomycetota bacterium]
MADAALIGIDLGGTNIKAGLLAASGRLLERWSVPTEADRGYRHVVGRLTDLVATIQRAAGRGTQPTGIGIGVPGPLSHRRGIIFGAPNLPGWVNVPLRDDLSKATGLPVSLENDANAAAFGEFVAGAGRGCTCMVLLTLGTGIGGGVVIDNLLVRGVFDSAGEVGHMIAVLDGRPCPCGQKGCLERYSSANAIAERVVEAVADGAESLLAQRIRRGDEINSGDVARACRDGCPTAKRIWAEACNHLAAACINLQHLLNPQRIVFSGGLINAGDQLLSPLREAFARLNWRVTNDFPELVFATLAEDAGLIGAAALAKEQCA